MERVTTYVPCCTYLDHGYCFSYIPNTVAYFSKYLVYNDYSWLLNFRVPLVLTVNLGTNHVFALLTCIVLVVVVTCKKCNWFLYSTVPLLLFLKLGTNLYYFFTLLTCSVLVVQHKL